MRCDRGYNQLSMNFSLFAFMHCTFFVSQPFDWIRSDSIEKSRFLFFFQSEFFKIKKTSNRKQLAMGMWE